MNLKNRYQISERPLRNADVTWADTLCFSPVNTRLHVTARPCGRHLYGQSDSFDEAQLQRIKGGRAAFRFQAVPLGVEKHSQIAFAAALWSSQKPWSLGDSWSSPHISQAHKGCTCKGHWIQGALLGRPGRKQLLVTQHWCPLGWLWAVCSLGRELWQGRPEAPVVSVPPQMLQDVAQAPKGSRNRQLGVPSDAGSGPTGAPCRSQVPIVGGWLQDHVLSSSRGWAATTCVLLLLNATRGNDLPLGSRWMAACSDMLHWALGQGCKDDSPGALNIELN